MSYPAYAETKPSGVDWLGDVPKDWKVMRLKHIASVSLSNVDKKSVEGQAAVLLCNYTDVYYNSEITPALNFMEATAPADQVKRFRLHIGDVLITKDSETPDDIGVPAVVAEELNGVVCGYHLAMLRPNNFTNGGYLRYSLASPPFRDHFRSTAHGVTRFGLALDDIGTALTFSPPLPEQQQIAAFLDRKTAELDAVLRLKERQLALLAEKRQALISQAVTRGLDPTAPLKPSGIPWLGDVPGHWEVSPLKFLASFAGGGTPAKENLEFWAGEIPWVSPKDMKSEWIDDSEDHISEEALATSATSMVATGTVLIVVRSGILKHTIPVAVNSVPVSLNQDMKAVIFGKRVEARYFAYLIRGCQNALLTLWRKAGATVESIEQEYLANTECPVPPRPEQQAIIAYLDRETARMDGIAQAIRTQIGKVREYRQALISAAVTGKIDVRGV